MRDVGSVADRNGLTTDEDNDDVVALRSEEARDELDSRRIDIDARCDDFDSRLAGLMWAFAVLMSASAVLIRRSTTSIPGSTTLIRGSTTSIRGSTILIRLESSTFHQNMKSTSKSVDFVTGFDVEHTRRVLVVKRRTDFVNETDVVVEK